MSDAALGYLLIGIGILFVLGIVFTMSTRESSGARAVETEAHPPEGVHLPPPSYLPVVMAVAAALLGIGLIFSPWLLIPAVLVLVAGAFGWFRAAGREWREMARREPHDDSAHR